MHNKDITVLSKQLHNILQNQPEKNQLIEVEEGLKEIERCIQLLSAHLTENKLFLNHISTGNLDAQIPRRDNYLSGGLKELHAILAHLTWQARQVEKGDYSQKVNFLGEFSNSFNNMASKLHERDQQVKEIIEKLNESYDKLKIILDQTTGVIFEYDIGKKEVYYSTNFEKIFGKTLQTQNFPQSALNMGFIHKDDAEKFMGLFGKIEAGDFHQEENIRIRRADGIYIWCLVNLHTIYNSEGRPMKAIGQLSDITFMDKLTGAPNRTKFEIDIADIVVEEPPYTYAFVLLNIDKFKVFNDTFGYESGDILLKIISNDISEMMKSGEIYARYVADQFYLMLKYEGDQEIAMRIFDLYDSIEEKFQQAISRHYNLVLCSGICVMENDNDSLNAQSNKAGYALREIKGSRKSTVAFYSKKIQEQIKKEKEIESKMHSALKRRDFHLFLQPKYLLKSGKIIGAEALVRWFDKEKGIVYPNDFIPIFETNGFVIELDMYMLRLACETIDAWMKRGLEPVPISINFSRLHLMNKNFVRELEEIVRKHKIPPKYIEIELTESTMFDNTQALILVLQELHSFGFTISMDDFGSGYSSLGMLKDLPIDIIKLDRSFFTDYIDYERGKAVVESVISLAKVLNILTVAEGVETEAHIDLLIGLNCDIVQGYYYAKPMAIEDFEKKLYSVESEEKANSDSVQTERLLC